MGIFNLFKPNIDKLKAEQNVKGLIKALKYVRVDPRRKRWGTNPVIEIRMQAAEILGDLKDKRAVKPLISLLKDKSAEVRLKAIESLKKLGDIRSIEPLIESLKDEGYYSTYSTIIGIGRVEDKVHICDEAKEAIVKIANENKLALSTNKEVIRALIKCLDYDLRHIGIVIVGDIGILEAVDPLIHLLSSVSENIRYKVAESLGKIGDIRAIEPLIKVLDDKESELRLAAVKAISKIGDSRAINLLIEKLNDPNQFVRMAAANALDNLNWHPHNENEQNQYYRAIEAWSILAKSGDLEAIYKLIDELKQENSVTIPSLIIENGKSREWLDQQRDKSRRFKLNTVGNTLVEVGEAAMMPLIKVITTFNLDDEQEDLLYEILFRIGRLNIRPFLHILKYSNWESRQVVAIVLGKIKDKRAVEALIQTLNDKVIDVRRTVIYSLGEIGDESAIKPLINLLKDEDMCIQETVKRAIKKIRTNKR